MAWPAGVTLRTCSLGPDFGIVSGDDYGCDIVVSVSRPMMTWGATGSGGIGDQDSLSFTPGLEITFQLPVTDQAGWYIGGLPIDVSDGQQSHVYTLTIKPWIYNSLGRKTFSNATLTLSNLAVPTGADTLDLDKSVATAGAQGGTVTIPDLVGQLQATVETSATDAAASASAAAASAQTAHDISNIDTSDDVVSRLVADPQAGPKTTAALNAAFVAWENVRRHGAVGDGVTDDSAAVQAAIDALPAEGGVVYFPRGRYAVAAGLVLDNLRNITLRGETATNQTSIVAQGTVPGTALVYTADAGMLLSAKTSNGITADHLALTYSSAAYADTLASFAGESSPTVVSSRYHRLNHCFVGALPGAQLDTGHPLLDLNNTVDFAADDCQFSGGRWNVDSVQNTTDYANVVCFRSCRFERYAPAYAAVHSAGEAWVFDGCYFEPASDEATTRAMQQAQTVMAKGAIFSGCWFGDGDSANAYIEWNGTGLSVHGGVAYLSNNRTLIKVNRNVTSAGASSAITVIGTWLPYGLQTTGAVVDTGVSTDTSDINIIGCRPLPATPVVGFTLDRPNIPGAANPRTVTANGALLRWDRTVRADATNGALVLTLPAVTAVGVEITIKKIDTTPNPITLTPASGTIDGASSYALTARNQWVTLLADGTNWQVIGGSRTSSQTRVTGNVVAGTGTTTMTFATDATDTFSIGDRYLLSIWTRTATPTRALADIPILISREANNATVALGTVTNQIGAAFGAGSGTHQISATVSTTGDTLTITVANTGAADAKYAARLSL